jgi:hypothetical protein
MYWSNRDRMSFLTSAATHIEVHRGVLKSGMINAQQKNRFAMGIGAHMTVILTPTLWDLPSVNLNNRLIPWKESFRQNQTN